MGSTLPERYDFIVVGAGAAGAVLASRLAKSKASPSVLLVEAGGRNDSKSMRADAERWLHRINPAQNWGYKTVPIKGFDGSILDYDRGKGLGGSTSINFSCWTIGPDQDHDEIARLVGDEEWNWPNAQQRYKRLESYHGAPPDVPSNYKKYLDPCPENHGYDGPINVGFPRVWEPSVKHLMDVWLENGTKPNPDHNSGDPIGLAICNSTAYKGIRSTSADALIGAPANLHVLIDTEVARVVFECKRAVGIGTFKDQTIYANKEIILSCGSLDTPRILMHSGIGPADQLEIFNIPILKENINVGQHMKDHHHIMLSFERADGTSERQRFYKNKDLQAAARARWERDGTGPLSEYGTTLGIGYLKLESMYETPEFQDLPEAQKEFLQQPTVPHYEIVLNGPYFPHFIDPENASAGTTVFLFLLNQQSTGSVKLQSSDPKIPLIFDPNFFSSAYDRRLAIEATKEIFKVIKSPQFSNDTVATQDAPKSESEEDILEFWKKTSASTSHMMGTARMGKDESEAVVDKDFKVFGVENLRVADMSVIPIVVK
jgi:choline dehydrogenase-like flavoprotein